MLLRVGAFNSLVSSPSVLSSFFPLFLCSLPPFFALLCFDYLFVLFEVDRMRIFFKFPTCELTPLDEMNAVPFIYKLSPSSPFRLAAEYPMNT